VERRAFDVILLDLMLPGMDGLEVVRQLRKAGRTMPVLVVTAKDRADDAIAGLDAGADDYIAKPFDLDELFARIRGALRRQTWAGEPSHRVAPESVNYGKWTVDFAKFVATDR
jgi:DNA-binding response OmpR family regulator